jgi:hypothetical protein
MCVYQARVAELQLVAPTIFLGLPETALFSIFTFPYSTVQNVGERHQGADEGKKNPLSVEINEGEAKKLESIQRIQSKLDLALGALSFSSCSRGQLY